MFSYIAGWFCAPKEILPVKNELKVKPPLEAEGLSSEPEDTINLALKSLHEYCIELQSRGDQVAYKSEKTHWRLVNKFHKDSQIYAINYFTYNLLKDPSIEHDEKKWKEMFEKIEGIIKKGFDEIERCSNAIMVGYMVEAGIPSCVPQYFGFPKPIYFDPENISSDYLTRLIALVPENLPSVVQMQKSNLEMFKITLFKSGISSSMQMFIVSEVIKLRLQKMDGEKFSQ